MAAKPAASGGEQAGASDKLAALHVLSLLLLQECAIATWFES
jgi:hypothetical protein